jgi:hypothetical protein
LHAIANSGGMDQASPLQNDSLNIYSKRLDTLLNKNRYYNNDIHQQDTQADFVIKLLAAEKCLCNTTSLVKNI